MTYNNDNFSYSGYTGYTPPPKQPKNKSGIAIIALCAVISLLVGAIGGYLGVKYASQGGAINGGTTVIYTGVTLKDKDGNDIKNTMSVGEVATLASPSVVEITTEAVATGSFMMQYVTEGAGSGVIITKDGFIATNHHVIAGATSISVRTSDGTSYKATLVGSDEKTDLAVIKIDAKDLPAAVTGEYEDCKVGDTVVAIGNPLGELGGTVTDGIISALDRDVTIDGNIMSLMQTNTAINPGNSGGGLFNTSGQLIGIVNAKSSGEGIEGLGFAIPINLANEVISDLIEHGYVTGRVETGIEVIEISDFQTAMYYRVQSVGLYVYSVTKGTNAEAQGLLSGDLIKSVNGQEVKTEEDYTKIVDKLKIGDEITFVVTRRNKDHTVKVTLEEYKPISQDSLQF